MLEAELERMGAEARSALKGEDIDRVRRDLNFQSDEDMFAAIGFGHVALGTVANKLRPPEHLKQQPLIVGAPKASGTKGLAVTLDGARNLMINRARCCAPLPGEEVIGYVSRGKGVSLHSAMCPNVAAYRLSEPERLVNIDWTESGHETYAVDIVIIALDRVGVLSEITALFSEAKINIAGAKLRALPDKTAKTEMTVEVATYAELNMLMTKIGNLTDVVAIERIAARGSRKPKRE
jgi:GTP pyrophosphokinase